MTNPTSTPQLSWFAPLQDEVAQLQAHSLGRTLQPAPSQGNFSSNDYLGLARHPAVAEAAIRALRDHGTGAGAARLLGGHSSLHSQLEDQLAEFKQTDATLLFPSGYTAALGAIPALVGANDFVLLDRLAHACLFDAARLSGATLRVFAHNQPAEAETILHTIRSRYPPSTRVLLVTESLFSMDGDLAPLTELAELKDRYAAWLMVDEAHATGVIGPAGRGLIAYLNLSHRVEIQLGTLSKALGVAGGFIAGCRDLIQLLIHRARTFLFTTGTPPALAAAASAALQLAARPEGDQLRTRLETNRRRFLRHAPPGIATLDRGTPILPWIVGSAERANALGKLLNQLGFFPGVVRPPTVPNGQARLRFSFSATHTNEELDGLAHALARLLPESDSA